MKKKKINIGRKLSFNKQTVAPLNAEAQQQIAGGAIITLLPNCTSRLDSCATIPPGGHICQLCP
ncbi:class I lanthipeptide [Chitinophaga flava]|uniref:Class I lanthipeptide n=1 Tax=Chitinophaga flava TaxID=2259036 RepID=A0A365XUY7_9BACT|nr:class I lanthipeptide [Chitinophaga flava]RBL90153.1 hypothetical protein DF182_27180 [Chitinophaga flava]